MSQCSSIWDPYIKKYIDKIESAQKQDTKQIPRFNENRYGIYANETTTLSGWKFQAKAIHWSSMNNEEIHTTGLAE